MSRLPTPVRTSFHIGHGTFFRIRLLISDSDRIAKIVDSMEREAQQIREEALKMCWYMRGGLTYTEAMNLSHGEREIIGKLVKENLETTKKTGLNFF